MHRNYFMAITDIKIYKIKNAYSTNKPLWAIIYHCTSKMDISARDTYEPIMSTCKSDNIRAVNGELVFTNGYYMEAGRGDSRFYTNVTNNILRLYYMVQGSSPYSINAFTLNASSNTIDPNIIFMEKVDDQYYIANHSIQPYAAYNFYGYTTINPYPNKLSTGTAKFQINPELYDSKVLVFSRNERYCDDLGNYIEGNFTQVNPNDPYPNAGDDPDEPPEGDFDYTPDPIDVPELPTTSVTDSGLVSLYAPTEAQLRALASFLWSDAFSLDTFKKMFNNPMDCILGLTILPINVPHGSAREITVGNIVSTVSCDTLPTQYIALDCGVFEFKQSAFTGSYLDFSPYTKCYVYLPFIGCQEIDIDEFMGSTMGVVYHIDILTGALFCYVTRNGSVIYTYAGCCAENVPLSSNDFSTTVGSIMQIGIAAAGAVATIASAGAATPATAAAATALQAKTAAGVTAAGITGASAVMNSKPSVAHSGSLGGGGGMMGVMYPYLIFIAPRASIPSDQNKYTGFPANKIVKISSLSGFNVIEAVNLEVKGANDSEMSEIDQYLKAGVII